MAEVLFSVTEKDCEWTYSRGSGKGGQKRNKTSSKVQCKHKASGAIGVSDDTRSQHQNKREAFLKMADTKTFKTWHKLEVSKYYYSEAKLEEDLEKAMNPKNVKVEVKSEGRWVPEGKEES